MVLKYWWMILVWALIIAGFLIYKKYIYRTKASKQKTTKKPPNKKVAHLNRVYSLPSFKSVANRYYAYTLITFAIVSGAALIAVLLSSRPSAQTIEYPDQYNRDIILCLDVSGSMKEANVQILDIFSELADGFKGERIGLIAFDSVAASVFPLTDDYQFAKEQLISTKDEINTFKYGPVLNSTMAGMGGSSLIGDGLASCVLKFDNTDQKRSRSIILATDNMALGNQLVTVAEAGALAKEKEVRVYGINPNDYTSDYYVDKNSAEYKEMVLSTDGAYYKVEDDTNRKLISDIIEQITKQEATRFKGSPMAIVSDKPLSFAFGLYILLVSFFALAWRSKL